MSRVERVASFAWRGLPPASVDEELVLYDDGSCWLVVRRPLGGSPSIGSYSVKPASADFRALARAGRGPTIFELGHQRQAADEQLMATANRVADAAREQPHAVASFHVRARGIIVDRQLRLSLAVVGSGRQAVQFDLDPTRCAVHYSRDGQPVAWYEWPKLEVGFISPEAEGLGGLNQRAVVRPAAFGVIAVEMKAPPAAAEVALQVAGWLYDALPDEDEAGRYEVRTKKAAIEL